MVALTQHPEVRAMNISGLVITLDGDRPDLPPALAACPSLTLGDRLGRVIPAVLDAESDVQATQVFEDLQQIPGVSNVEVVYVQLDDQPASAAGAQWL